MLLAYRESTYTHTPGGLVFAYRNIQKLTRRNVLKLRVLGASVPISRRPHRELIFAYRVTYTGELMFTYRVR